MQRSACIIELPSAQDLLAGHSEAAVVRELCKLLGIEVAVLHAKSPSELASAARIVSQAEPTILHFSGHGSPEGDRVFLADGTSMTWGALLNSPNWTINCRYLLTSVCHAMTGLHLAHAARRLPQPPQYVVGFEGPITWSSAAISLCSLYTTLVAGNDNDLLGAASGIYLTHGINVVIDTCDQSPESRVSGASFLDLLCKTLVSRERGAFESLITTRGLLSPGWKQFWDRQDEASDRLRKARFATDLLLARMGRTIETLGDSSVPQDQELIQASNEADAAEAVQRVLAREIYRQRAED